MLVKRLLESETLTKWFQVSSKLECDRQAGKIGMVIGVFKPHYYEGECNWIIEVYHYKDKRSTFYIPEELAVVVIPPALKRAGFKFSP